MFDEWITKYVYILPYNDKNRNSLVHPYLEYSSKFFLLISLAI